MNINRLNFEAGEVVNDKLYCSNMNMNGLFSINMSDMSIQFIGFFEDNPVDSQFLHRDCMKYKEWLIFIPNNAAGINFYNYNMGIFKNIEINGFANSPLNGIIKDGNLWLIPIEYIGKIWKINLEQFVTEEVQISEQNDLMGQLLWRVCLYNDDIYAAIFNSNKIWRFHINDGTYEILSIDAGHITAVNSSGKGLWLLMEQEKYICLWDIKDNIIEKYIKNVKDEGYGRICSYVWEHEECVYLFPGMETNSILKICGRTIEEVKETAFPDRNNASMNYFSTGTLFEEKLLIYPFNFNDMYIFDGQELKKLALEKLNINNEDVFSKYVKSIMKEKIIHEDRLELPDFIDFIFRK